MEFSPSASPPIYAQRHLCVSAGEQLDSATVCKSRDYLTFRKKNGKKTLLFLRFIMCFIMCLCMYGGVGTLVEFTDVAGSKQTSLPSNFTDIIPGEHIKHAAYIKIQAL